MNHAGNGAYADVVIVGAGHGGAQAAIALRQIGYAGSITLIGREHELPYERPPLSKEYLAGQKPFERMSIRPPQYWFEKDVELKLGEEVSQVDPASKLLSLSDGSRFGYDKLIWATGGEPRRLTCPGADLSGIHTIRTRADSDRLIADVGSGGRTIVVVGGGYIGLEAAATLTKQGCAVTLLEALPRILARVAGPEVSSFYEAEHRSHGVDVRTDVAIAGFVGDTRVSGVVLADGEVLNADAVIVGIGLVPSVAALLEAGAAGKNGVRVDGFCKTSLPDVFAIGDCAEFACDYAGGAYVRLESVQNANDQAICVARTICGDEQSYHALPWFWSNQYDLRLQTCGLNIGYDYAVLRGSPRGRSFSVIYFKCGQIIALDCINSTRDYAQGRKLVEMRLSPDPIRVADVNQPLRDLAVRV